DLGCGAYLYELKRTKIGNYQLTDAFEIEDLIKIFQKRN
ncbi:MAG: tRNA pseudouridine(55) synthase, partial [Ignavibacteria bacterium]|nr:tRNA pseudouridine(55) synthase [Ignavibacteria bacterium]